MEPKARESDTAVGHATHMVRHVWSHPANRNRRGVAVARLLGWQVWERTIARPVTIRVPGGMRMKCYPHSAGASGVLYCRMPEWPEMPFLADLLRAGDAVVDVGANVGAYTLLAAATPGVAVWAFEPSSPTFARLAENVALNGLDQRVVVQRVAVGATAGTVRLSTGNDLLNRVLAPDEQQDSEEVPLVTLDDVIPPEVKVRVVKVNVEGLEEDVLRGASRILEAGPALILRLHDPANRAQVSTATDSLFAFLRELGYRACSYHPASHRLTEATWSQEGRAHVLAVRDLADMQARVGPVTS
ncbi:MAG: FkbM family methyltransferase [Actinomycetota bacterium]|nr:FkbM family methyltransferase [Actinomycetota bacterium]